MVSQLEDTDGGILTFNPNYLDWIQDQDLGKTHRPWGLGRIYDSDPNNTLMGRLQGINPIVRTPGRYCRIDLESGKEVKNAQNRLKNTGECIHPSVRIRMNLHGLDTEEDPDTSLLGKLVTTVKNFVEKGGVGVYHAEALENYTLVQSAKVQGEHEYSKQSSKEVIWKAKDGQGDLAEDVLGTTEIRMLERSTQRTK